MAAWKVITAREILEVSITVTVMLTSGISLCVHTVLLRINALPRENASLE